MVNVDWLSYFMAVVETGSFQGAANRAHVTPQAVSKAIASLESHYRVKLFERDQRIRRLTPEGQTLLNRVPEILMSLESLEGALVEHRKGQPVGPVSIASVTFCHTYLLPPLLAELVTRHPRIVPQLLAMPSEQVEERVAAGEVDLGVIFGQPRRADLAWSGGRMNPSVIVARPQPMRPWHELSYVVPRAFGSATESLDGWPGGGFRRRVVAEVNVLEAAIHLCEAGVGAAFVPELAVRERIRQGTLAIVADPPVPIESPFFIVRRAGGNLSPAARVVLERLEAL